MVNLPLKHGLKKKKTLEKHMHNGWAHWPKKWRQPRNSLWLWATNIV